MGYTKTTWETGDVITAEKLNKIENGIGDVCFKMVGVTMDSNSTITEVNFTYNDVASMFSNHITPCCFVNTDYNGNTSTMFLICSTISKDAEGGHCYAFFSNLGGDLYGLAWESDDTTELTEP